MIEIIAIALAVSVAVPVGVWAPRRIIRGATIAATSLAGPSRRVQSHVASGAQGRA